MMEKARRLLSVMMMEAQTSLCSLRERDPEETATNTSFPKVYLRWPSSSSTLGLAFSISVSNILAAQAKNNSA